MTASLDFTAMSIILHLCNSVITMIGNINSQWIWTWGGAPSSNPMADYMVMGGSLAKNLLLLSRTSHSIILNHAHTVGKCIGMIDQLGNFENSQISKMTHF